MPKTDDHLNTPEVILDMPVQKDNLNRALCEGACDSPGVGEKYEEMDKLLSNPDYLERHLKIVKQWLTERFSDWEPAMG